MGRRAVASMAPSLIAAWLRDELTAAALRAELEGGALREELVAAGFRGELVVTGFCAAERMGVGVAMVPLGPARSAVRWRTTSSRRPRRRKVPAASEPFSAASPLSHIRRCPVRSRIHGTPFGSKRISACLGCTSVPWKRRWHSSPAPT